MTSVLTLALLLILPTPLVMKTGWPELEPVTDTGNTATLEDEGSVNTSQLFAEFQTLSPNPPALLNVRGCPNAAVGAMVPIVARRIDRKPLRLPNRFDKLNCMRDLPGVSLNRVATLRIPRRTITTAVFWKLLGSLGNNPCLASYSVAQLQLPQTWVFYDARHLSEDGDAGAYVRVSNDTLPIDVPAVWDSTGALSIMSVPFTYEQAYVHGFTSGGVPVGNLRTPGASAPVPVYWGARGSADVTLVTHFGSGGAVTAGSTTNLMGETADPSQAGYVHRMTIWDLDGTNPRLVTGLGPGASRVAAANDHGTYVGSIRTVDAPFVYRSVVGRNGTASELAYPGFNTLVMMDVNNHDWMVGGWTPDGGASLRSFLAKAFGEEIFDLGLLPGYASVAVRAINDGGEIVGSTNSGFGRALYWHPGTTTPVDFNTMVNIPGETLVEAIDINNAGQILARGFNGYYILTPTVPEPLAVAMFAMAIPLLASRRRVCIGRDRADNSAACPTL